MATLPNITNFTRGITHENKLSNTLGNSKLIGLDEKLVAALRDAAYITVGFGVLTVQQAQVRRREVVKALADRFGASKGRIEELLTTAEARIKGIEQRFDTAVEKLEGRLPQQAAAIVGQAHDLAKAARSQVRSRVRVAA